MARRIFAPVEPEAMRWARESAGYTRAGAAEKLKHPESVIEAWETGAVKPSLAQAKKVAHAYRYPLNVLYLKEISESFPEIPDLRSSQKNRLVGPESWSPNLRWLIRQGYDRQAIARELLRAESIGSLDWVGSEASMAKKPGDLASQIRDKLNVSIEDQFRWKDTSVAFSEWIDQIEANGVFVHQSNHHPAYRIETAEMRGLALADNIAPFIILNNYGAPAGKIFTLMHEFTHLWIGKPGISGDVLFRNAKTNQERIELYCNRVAAEILIPDSEYKKAKASAESGITEEWIAKHASKFKVSKDAMACRAREQGDLSWESYLEFHAKCEEEWKAERLRQAEERSKKESGGVHWPQIDSRVAGRALSRLAFSAYQSGELGILEVSNVLGVKINRLPDLADKVGAIVTGMGQTE